MRPVREFKANFDQPVKMEPLTDISLPDVAANLPLHEAESSARNVCFVWPDGRKTFLNYAYLIAGEYEPNDEKNVIRLSFSSHSVTLQGYSLELLFMELLDHLPRIITAIDPRYAVDEDEQKSVVISITIDKSET